MKTLICRYICIIFCLSFLLTSVSMANSMELQENQAITEQLNEYDLYVAIQKLPDDVLHECGYSEEQIDDINSINYKQEIFNRSTLPDSELEKMGYDSDEISALRNYTGSEAETKALSATLTASFLIPYSSASMYSIEYGWSWNHSPLIEAKDAMGIRWVAVASDGLPVDVTASNSTAKVKYYEDSSLYKTVTYNSSSSNFSKETDFNALTCTFPMQIVGASDENVAYALKGSMITNITKDSGISRDIYYLKVCGVYGHSVINFGTPSVSFTSGALSIGISFNGGLNINNIGILKYKVYTNGSKEAIDA